MGINLQNPGAKLEIRGALGFSSSTKRWEMNYDSTAGYFYIDEFGAGRRLFIKDGGNIGIGTSSPAEKLEVNGAVKIGNTSTSLPGTIRFNTSNNDFEGFDGTQWRSLTANGIFAPAQSDTGYSQQAGDNFGFVVKMLDDYLFVGAPNADVNGNANQGTVTIYKKNIFTGKYEIFQTISSPDGTAGDQFGSAVEAAKFSGGDVVYKSEYLIVGVPKKTVNGHTNQGAVYLFVKDIETGLFRITSNGIFSPADGAAGDQFGTNILIYFSNTEGLSFFVGAPSKTVNGNLSQGRVYKCSAEGGPIGPEEVYLVISPQTTSIDPPVALPFGFFGYSISKCPCDFLNRQNSFGSECNNGFQFYTLIGAPGATVNGNAGRGKVFGYVLGAINIFDTSFTNSDGAVNDNFGISIALVNKRVYVGASGKQVGSNTTQGKVYILKDTLTGGGGAAIRCWKETGNIHAADGQSNDRFGSFIRAFDDMVLISAINRDNAVTDAGAIYVYEKLPGASNYTHNLRKIITDPIAQAQNFIGKTFDCLGNNYVIGVPDWDNPGRLNSGKIIFGTIY